MAKPRLPVDEPPKKRGRPPKPKMPAPPRQHRATGELARMAYLAGRGKTAGEIATIVGSTPSRVRAALHGMGVELIPKRAGERAGIFVVPEKAMRNIEALATRHDVQTFLLVGRLIARAPGEILAAAIADCMEPLSA